MSLTPVWPGLLHRRYQEAVTTSGFDSTQAQAAWAEWLQAAGEKPDNVDRALHTARPFGDTRPINVIYPTPGGAA